MSKNIYRCGRVVIAYGAVIDHNVTLGHHSNGNLEIGSAARIRSGCIIYSEVSVGRNFISGHNVLIRENTTIGDDTLIGTNTIVDGYCNIGNRVSVQTGAYITRNTLIEDDVFIGPCVVTTNDKKMESGAELRGPIIKRGARIGASAVLLPGITIGENAVVGAGSIVTHDVPAGKTVVGNPARIIEVKTR